MSVLVHVRCEGVGEQEVLAVATDPVLSVASRCAARGGDKAGIYQVRWRKYPQAGFGFE